MYHLYHTSGFVLGSSPHGEGNKSFTLLTRELGLITATAQSVREERSKLRYGLQNLSLSEFTLVRGKDSWRLTGALCEENLYTTFRATPEVPELFGRIFRLLRRLVTGEEKNEKLFAAITEAYAFLKSIRTYESAAADTKYEITNVEIVLVLRILFLLGYLAPRGEFGAVLSDISLWNDSLLSDAKGWRALALADINNSLKESQL